MSYRVDRQGSIANETEWYPCMEAAEARVRELVLKGVTGVVAWEQSEHVGPWVEPVVIELEAS